MKHFVITIEGVPPKEVADNLWANIVQYDVNLLVLDKHSYIYGNATDSTVELLLKEAEKLGFAVEIERG